MLPRFWKEVYFRTEIPRCLKLGAPCASRACNTRCHEWHSSSLNLGCWWDDKILTLEAPISFFSFLVNFECYSGLVGSMQLLWQSKILCFFKLFWDQEKILYMYGNVHCHYLSLRMIPFVRVCLEPEKAWTHAVTTCTLRAVTRPCKHVCLSTSL